KPIYQPGQIFNARVLLLRRNQLETTVVADADLTFTIKDQEGTTLYKESVKTSQFGIASISWKIPENAKLGIYTVEVDSDDFPINQSLRSFKVSRYELPQFTV
ncbi:MG2 domain-containing protein, partial [Escherichia coli]|uniref:MG2 domain-containing protein n=1 Tax=Escherichia coli TaxID=562 RepID=UPI00128F7E74